MLAPPLRNSKASANFGDYIQLFTALASIESPDLGVREDQFHTKWRGM
jgi:hypothetical protein